MGTTGLAWQNYAKNATITAGTSAATGLGPENVATDHGSRQYAWQTQSGTTADTLTVTPTTPSQSWQVAGIFGTNLTSSAAVTFRWYLTGGSLVTSKVCTGPAAGYGQVIGILSTAVVANYMTVQISDPGNPEGFLNVPLLFGGPLWKPAYGRTFRSTFGRDHRTDRLTTLGGQEFPSHRWTRRWVGLDFDATAASSELWQYAMALDVVARTETNVLAIPTVDGANVAYEAVFGIMRTSDQMAYGLKTVDRVAWNAKINERL